MAVVLACATFPLIWVGGLVTTYDAGMAVPDWPTTYGYNLFLYPWETWVYGPFDLFIEHGHRLLGAGVGMLTIGLLGVVWFCDRRPWMRAVAVAALLAVIAQGVLGGLRVRLDARQLAMLHGCFGPAFFALTAATTVFTSRWWKAVGAETDVGVRRMQPLALLTLVLAYGQLVVGSLLRHTPVDATFGFFRGAVVFHLILAAALLLHAGVLHFRSRRDAVRSTAVRRSSGLLFWLIVMQGVLGVTSWVVKYGWPAWSARWAWNADYTVQTNTLFQSLSVTAHVANGSLILATAAVVAACVCRQSGLEGLQADSTSRRSAELGAHDAANRSHGFSARRASSSTSTGSGRSGAPSGGARSGSEVAR